MTGRPAWHALFASLPPDAIPRRTPVASPDVLARPEAAAIAGWEQLILDLSSTDGMRVCMVTLDASGRPVSASDLVLYRTALADGVDGDPRPAVRFEQHTVGGRLEADGTFHGTRWHTIGLEHEGEDEPAMQMTPSTPTADDIAAIKALVAEIVRRAAR